MKRFVSQGILCWPGRVESSNSVQFSVAKINGDLSETRVGCFLWQLISHGRKILIGISGCPFHEGCPNYNDVTRRHLRNGPKPLIPCWFFQATGRAEGKYAKLAVRELPCCMPRDASWAAQNGSKRIPQSLRNSEFRRLFAKMAGCFITRIYGRKTQIGMDGGTSQMPMQVMAAISQKLGKLLVYLARHRK